MKKAGPFPSVAESSKARSFRPLDDCHSAYARGISEGLSRRQYPTEESTLPSGIALDRSGNVLVADTGNSTVKKVPHGCLTSDCVTTLGGGFSVPYGVAVDRSGNVFVADTGNSATYEIPPGCVAAGCVAATVLK